MLHEFQDKKDEGKPVLCISVDQVVIPEIQTVNTHLVGIAQIKCE
jgi:hypothetical protein